jgi:hypothetical protein
MPMIDHLDSINIDERYCHTQAKERDRENKENAEHTQDSKANQQHQGMKDVCA